MIVLHALFICCCSCRRCVFLRSGRGRCCGTDERCFNRPDNETERQRGLLMRICGVQNWNLKEDF